MSAPVLIAYDGSDHAKAAIAEAGRQLEAGREAIVLTVTEPMEGVPFLGAAGVPVDAESVESLFSAARAGAEKTAEEGCAAGPRSGPGAGADGRHRRPGLEPDRRRRRRARRAT